MASVAEVSSSFDDCIEITGVIVYPVVASTAFTGRTPSVSHARAFRVDGGGDIVVKTAAGVNRTLTAIENPYFTELKITQIVSATAATKIRLFA